MNPRKHKRRPWFDDRGKTGLSSTATESFKKTWYTPAVSLVVRRGFTLQYCTGSILDAEYSHRGGFLLLLQTEKLKFLIYLTVTDERFPFLTGADSITCVFFFLKTTPGLSSSSSLSSRTISSDIYD